MQSVETMEEQTQQRFLKYNEKFFEGKLTKIKLEWSNRMRLSAAIFYPNKYSVELGKICFNRKLLKARSEKEVKETLLHEMTHAYLQQIYGNTIKPHGKEFQAKILEINIALDFNITVLHNFLTWWRCDGVCRVKSIFFYGYLSGVDEKQIFISKGLERHDQFCGGTFQKAEQPNSEILSELRQIKRKRKSNVQNEILKLMEGGGLTRHDALKNFKKTRYSTDEGEEKNSL